MKRFSAKAVVSLALILMLLVSLCVPAFAATTVLSTQNLKVNGKDINCEKYNIDGNNYFKLRDLAEVLDGTNSQFDVDYDEASKTMVVTTGAPYTHKNGTELKTGVDNSASAVVSPQTLKIDGEIVKDLAVYNIGGNNYFKLRDLGKAVHFYVHYDEATRTMLVDESEEDEAWDTGDASKDKPRNEDGIGETEVLVVSFGTSFNDSRVATIGAIENAMEKAFPGYSVRRGFTANIIIDHVYKRDDEKIDDITEALDRAVANGVKNLLVQPTHLMNGYEYTDVQNELKKYEGKFETIVLGAPILTTDEDYDVVIKAITDDTKQFLDGQTAICFMGHGTENASNHVYADMQAKLTEKGFKDYFVGTVEAEPTFQEVVDAVKAAGYKKVILEPLMIVAGDHANNDMADPEDPESWYSLFKAAGIEPTARLKGLGEFTAIQDLLVEHLKEAAAEALDEDYDTGDASKDDPRNADGIGEKELLVVSFGTSFNDNRVATIGAIENAMEKAFPDYSVRRGFTANIIIDHVLRRDGEKIDDLTEALDRAVANGVKELLVVPTHLMNGFEYTDVQEALKEYGRKFDKVSISAPILTTDADYDAVIKAITEDTKQFLDGQTAICFMGHGTENASNHVYADMQAKLTAAGYKDYFVGTVEAEPTFQEVVDAVKAAGYKKVILEPLMIVAGDHANNDMADPEDPESWYSLFKAAGIEPTARLKGLGEFTAIQDLLVAHAKEALAAAPAAEKSESPARNIAAKADMNSRKSVEKEGASPITADKLNDGTYDITVTTGNSMFRISNAKLIVKDGKMTATFNTSKSYTWLFMGKTDDIAAADESAFLKGAIGEDGAPGYTIDVEALNQALDCSSYSKNKDQWYPNVLLFDADTLPAGALK
jgi:sirohydrochlorin cobaltochelatase